MTSRLGDSDIELELDCERSPPARLRCWLISLTVHTALLIALTFFVLPRLPRHTVQVLRVSTTENDAELPLLSVPIVTLIEPVDHEESAESQVDIPIAAPVSQVAASDLAMLNRLDPAAAKMLTRPSLLNKNEAAAPRHVSGTSKIRRSGDIAEAMSMVGKQVEGELIQGDTLVVWLLDASISLRDSRAAMAWYANEFYQTVDWDARSRGELESHLLLTSVVAFGSAWKEVVKPTENGTHAIEAIKNIPIDQSGKENTMSAIEDVVTLYRSKRGFDERMMVVVLTDESGDDTDALEDTIAACREAAVAVHVIGPTAVMGMQQGWQHNTVKQGSVNYSFWLSVNRGPESAFPERLFFPYWHQSQLPPWEYPGVRSVEDGDWYGSAYRERLMSGFGPYALTRLALQTGGSYTLFDPQWREHGQGAYSMERLREYFPSYDSADEYLACVAECPLRQFVVDAAAVSLQHPQLFAPPRTTFLGRRSPYYPFNIERVHCQPSDFEARFQVAMGEERKRVAAAGDEVAKLIERLGDPAIDWDREWELESCKRWKAWFLLTKGRLLATRARQLEYLAAADDASVSPNSNCVNLLPDRSLHAPPSQSLIEGARRSLQQCIADHPGTPWHDMAAWELEQPFGFRVEQATLAKASPSIIAGPTKTPTEFNFPRL